MSPPRQRVTTPMGTARAVADKAVEDPTRMDPQATSKTQRFVTDDLLQTTMSAPAQPQRRPRTTTPMGTAASEPQPSVILATQQVLTREVPPDVLEALAAEGAVERQPAVSVRKTEVWVATHKAPDDPDRRLILVREPDSSRAASFRVLRHRLQQRGDPRVIAVTSAGAREGKTTCAVNLALALGECGRARVLLVEANLRSPSLAPLFGFMPPQCFSVQMQKHKEKPMEGWSVVEVYSEYLHVLAVQPTELGGRPLLDGPAFAIAMETLGQAGYDYIVVDTPPVLGSADVNLIEDSADGVLFTARARATRSRALRAAMEQLAPAKLLGVMLLDV